MRTSDPDTVAALLRESASRRPLWLRADGTSMGATIVAGSEVRIGPYRRPPRPAEIWAFCSSNGDVVVHRYRGRRPDGRFEFRGDAQEHTDEPVPVERLVGRAVAVRSDSHHRALGWSERARWLAARGMRRVRRLLRPGRRR
jgi:hypothetical protein